MLFEQGLLFDGTMLGGNNVIIKDGRTQRFSWKSNEIEVTD
jgi:hypothetical protein